MKRFEIKLTVLAVAVCLIAAAGCKKQEPVKNQDQPAAQTSIEAVDTEQMETAAEEPSENTINDVEELKKALKEAGIEISDDVQQQIDNKQGTSE